ncbi:MAG TPA: dephospho-CoA kinase, partial [Acidimicrobiales bacterium]|nr:dephospho-CoA kinase [Acidimicrobiales bacterium]
MVVVGLTGGIGAGKSSVSSLLVERGAVLIDADAIVRELQASGGAAIAPTVERFGPDILDATGAVDRPKLAAIVFADDDARRDNNAIVHPLVGATIAERLAELASTEALVVLDVPLLVEGRSYDLAGVIVVDCPAEIAMDRLVRLRGMDADDVARRMAAQATREQRLA